MFLTKDGGSLDGCDGGNFVRMVRPEAGNLVETILCMQHDDPVKKSALKRMGIKSWIERRSDKLSQSWAVPTIVVIDAEKFVKDQAGVFQANEAMDYCRALSGVAEKHDKPFSSFIVGPAGFNGNGPPLCPFFQSWFFRRNAACAHPGSGRAGASDGQDHPAHQ
jgi:hypothetical protein